MPSERVLQSVDEVARLLERGAVYVDVRSREEFVAGHVPGAVNVPFKLGTLAGLVENPSFEAELSARLVPGMRLIVGCRSGGRARAAIGTLSSLGYECWLDALGFDGARDAFGRLSPGWSRSGRPVETGDGAASPPGPSR